MWDLLPEMPSTLGKLCASYLEDRVPPDDKQQGERGPDLLPLHPNAVDLLESVDEQLRAGLKLLVMVLNYLSMGGRVRRHLDFKCPSSLSKGQILMLSHLHERLVDLSEEAKMCPAIEQSSRQLATAKFDYMGEPIMAMEPIIADKVIPIWPEIGQCAVLPVLDLLPDDLKGMIEDPSSCLKPMCEWPEKPHRSKVMATQGEWDKVVKAAWLRGLMVPMSEDQVFKDQQGRMVLNGAGAVKKLKRVGGEEQTLQRFISNLIPSNEFQAHLSGGDRYLPYLGQLTLLEQTENETYLVDSEDFSSCFNLFKLPPVWFPYMCFEKTVDGKIFGLTPGEHVYPAMSVVPMGWINSVTVIQSVVRSLVFQGADIPEDSEVTKVKRLPKCDDLTVIYLDSYDELRRLDKQCAEVLQGGTSERHDRFTDLCAQKGLPLNEGKRLVGATKGTLQGGLLNGEKGWYQLASDKQVDLIGLCCSLLGHEVWKEFELRHFIGKATFGMCFRRPLLSIFQNIFADLRERCDEGPGPPSNDGMDEVVMVMATVCLMGSCLRVTLDREVSCSDASEEGGGGAVSDVFMPEPCSVEHDGSECWWCDRAFPHEQRYPCPSKCGAALCSLECIAAHRDPKKKKFRTCLRADWNVPRFGERFSGPNAPLSHAVAKVGGFDIQPPFDLSRGLDFFKEEDKEYLHSMMDDPYLYAEHWAPDCKLFSRARGRPITLQDGRQVRGPQPVCDEANLMGFRHLPPEMKGRLRKSNAMALKALKRGEVVQEARQPRHWSCEHPRRSWMWEFTVAKRLEERGMLRAVGSHCCFGGLREKWFAFLNTSEEITQRLSMECPGHEGLLTYQVEERPDGTLYYPTEEEAEYPWALCLAYARGLKAQCDKEGVFEDVRQEAREAWYVGQLASSTKRLQDFTLATPMATFLYKWERSMTQGEEMNHLRDLLHSASMRGTDIRFHLLAGEDDAPQEVPYPAMRWKWRTVTSYPWKIPGHINELELNAFVVMSKHRGRSTEKFHTRWMHVLDSMVTRGALAKGRSSSVRLNRPLRKHAAAALAQNSYAFPLWTISGWNFSDKASRRHGKSAKEEEE